MFDTIPNRLQLLRVLITCSHALNDINTENRIKLVFGDEKEKLINLDDSRKMYTKSEYDITIIEIKENEFD